MANTKQAQPKIKYTSMSTQDFNSLLSGGNLAKPLYEFDADGNAIYHEENLQYYSPNVVLTNPFTGRDETASTIVDYVKNEEEHKKAVEQTYNSLMKYNHSYNVDAKALQAIKAIPEFAIEGALTLGETVGNIANAVHSVGRTVQEENWKARRNVASDRAKKEMEDILVSFENEDLALAYVKNHDFDNDLTISDEAKGLFKSYRSLLNSRDNDNLWSNVLDQTFSGAREEGDKLLNENSGGNKYQNIGKFAQFSGNIAGSLGAFKVAGKAANLFKYASTAANAAKAEKLGAAFIKAYGVTGKTSVYGTAFLNQYDSLRRHGLAKGLSYDEANSMAFFGAAWEAFVEGWGMGHYGRLSAKKSIWNVIRSEVAPEAVEEMFQTGGENAFKALYGVNDNTFRDVVEEIILSGLGGALAGGAVGGIEYFSGQSSARAQAAREIRAEEEAAATEAAKARNAELLERERKKLEQQPPTDGGEPPAAGAAGVVAQTAENTQQAPKMAQQMLPYNEQRILLEHDEQFAKDMAAAQDKFKQTLKEIMSEKLKKINPDITQEQIDNASALLYRVSNKIDNNDAYGEEISAWADSIVKWSNEKAPQYAQNLAELDKRFGIETLGLTAEDIKMLNSGKRIEANTVGWKLVKASIRTDFRRAGVSEKMANKLAETFEQVFSTTALLSNVSPVDLYYKLSPRIISLTRARLNKQTIEGYQGVLDNIPFSTKATGELQRIEAESILEDLTNEDNSQEAQNKKEVALNELFRGLDTKADVTADDVDNVVEERSRIEHALADEMGISYGRDFTTKEYRTMALMRARGATQSKINDAFGITDRVDPEDDYAKAVKKRFPELTPEEYDQAKKLVSKAFADRPFSKISAFYAPDTADEIASQAGMDITEGRNVGGSILLGADTNDKIAAEEFFHAISVKLEEAAKIQAIKDSGKKIFAAYDIYSVGLLPETRPLARLFNELTQPINGIEQTDRQKHETIATAFVNHVMLEIMPQSQKEALNLHNGEVNDVIATAEDSKYKDLTPEQKKALGERFTNLFKPNATGDLIKAGNQIANAGGNFDVQKAKELALKTLDQYEVYNDAQWAYLFSTMDNMDPQTQLDLCQSFGQVLVQQGYDSLTAEMYDVDFDDDARQVLIQKAYKENSYFTEDDDPTIYYHSETKNPDRRISKYKNDSTWWNDVKKWAKKTFDPQPLISDYIETLSHAAFKADPVIGTVLRRAMYGYGQRQVALQKLAAKIPQLIDQYNLGLLTDEDKRPAFIVNFKNVLLSGNYKARQKAKLWMMEQFAGTGAMEEVGKTMDDIYAAIDSAREDLIARGVPVGFIKEYWPSYVNDREGLAEFLGKAAPMTQTGKMINRLVKQLSKKFPKSSLEELRNMAIDAINKQWHKYEMGEDVSAFHKRGNYFNAETSDFYEDPFETLARYFENVNRTLMMRELTGRVIPSQETEGEYSTGLDRALVLYRGNRNAKVSFGDKETGKLGKAFAFALSKANPNMEALDNFAKKMKMYVNKVGNQSSEFTRFWERTNSLLLGNPISVLNQFNELPLILHNFGLEVTNDAIQEAVEEILKEAEKDPNSPNLENINVQALQELIRYKDNDLLAKLTDMVHTVSGFSGADILLKNIEIKACLKGAQQVLKSGNVDDVKFKRFMRIFDNTFPEAIYSDKTRQEIFEDLKAGNLTDNVKFFAFNYLSNVQPINMAEVPTGFLTAGPVGRLVYQYHTTPLRQLEYVADDIRWGFDALPLKDALKNLLSYMFFFMAIGVPIEVLQNLLRGRTTNLAEAAVYSPLQLLSINEYTINSIRQRGLFSGIIQELSPSFRVGDDVTKDVIRMVTMKDYKGHAVKDVPLAGPFVYYWLLGGRDYAKRQGEAVFHDSEADNRRANALKAIRG